MKPTQINAIIGAVASLVICLIMFFVFPLWEIARITFSVGGSIVVFIVCFFIGMGIIAGSLNKKSAIEKIADKEIKKKK